MIFTVRCIILYIAGGGARDGLSALDRDVTDDEITGAAVTLIVGRDAWGVSAALRFPLVDVSMRSGHVGPRVSVKTRRPSVRPSVTPEVRGFQIFRPLLHWSVNRRPDWRRRPSDHIRKF